MESGDTFGFDNYTDLGTQESVQIENIIVTTIMVKWNDNLGMNSDS